MKDQTEVSNLILLWLNCLNWLSSFENKPTGRQCQRLFSMKNVHCHILEHSFYKNSIFWYNHYEKNKYEGSSKELKIEIPYHPEIPLLGIHLKEIKSRSQRAICTPMFLQHYSQQPRHGKNLSVHHWQMDNEIYTYIYFVHTYIQWTIFSHKKEGNPAICDNMEGTWVHYAQWDKLERDKYCMTFLIWGI